jgi:hypothetical protein
MPLLLAALVFRVLAVPGFMMGGSEAMSLQASMCTTTPGKIETIELPGSSQPHCEYCVAPPLGAPFAQLLVEPPLRAAEPAFIAVSTQIDGLTLLRAQSARAPPRA